MALYDRIGVGYDDTRQADPYLRSRLIHHLRPSPSGRYLDIGSGICQTFVSNLLPVASSRIPF